jgi:hypothetical protein
MKLAQARRVALSFPESTEAPHFHFTSFRVGEKIFATAPPDEKYLHIFVDESDRDIALALHGEWMEKLFWGAKVVGLRVTLATAKPKVVSELLKKAWARKAPKRLLV